MWMDDEQIQHLSAKLTGTDDGQVQPYLHDELTSIALLLRSELFMRISEAEPWRGSSRDHMDLIAENRGAESMPRRWHR
jgi:hypothetical protein